MSKNEQTLATSRDLYHQSVSARILTGLEAELFNPGTVTHAPPPCWQTQRCIRRALQQSKHSSPEAGDTGFGRLPLSITDERVAIAVALLGFLQQMGLLLWQALNAGIVIH
jgi:hypothetical protein